MLSLKVLKAMARNLQCTVRLRDGEYRINNVGAPEAVAYYTTDKLDALHTMEAMYVGRLMISNPALAMHHGFLRSN